MFYISRTDGHQTPFDIAQFRQTHELQKLKRSDEVAKKDQQKSPKDQRLGGKYGDRQESKTVREPAITASQIMSSPTFTLDKDSKLEEAKQLFADKRFRHVPVVDENKKLVGILSDRDFLSDRLQSSKAKTIGEVMTTFILTARPEALIRQIADVMFRERVGSMPIVDNNEQLLGIVTRSDILRTLVNTASLKLWV